MLEGNEGRGAAAYLRITFLISVFQPKDKFNPCSFKFVFRNGNGGLLRTLHFEEERRKNFRTELLLSFSQLERIKTIFPHTFVFFIVHITILLNWCILNKQNNKKFSTTILSELFVLENIWNR